MKRLSIRFGAFLAVTLALAALVTPVWAVEGAPKDPPRLVVAAGDGASSVVVEWRSAGAVQRHLLREGAVSPVTVAGAWDDAGRSGFLSWAEAGVRWTSYTLDGGTTWTEARAVAMDLRLAAGSVEPGDPMPGAGSLSLPEEGRLFIVQLASVALPAWRAQIGGAGAEVLQYLPHNGYVVRLGDAAVSDLEALPIVERIEPYHPAYRMEDALRSWVEGRDEAGGGDAGAGDDGERERRIRVMAFQWGPAGKERILAAAEALGARAAEYWPSGQVLELWASPEQLRRLVAHDDVMWVDRWTPRENDMDLVREDSGTNWLETNFGICGQGVRGEVMDSGLQSDHPDFGGETLFHGSFDSSSHGTSTYGIVFGKGLGNPAALGHMPCSEAQGIFADYNFLGDRFVHTQELKSSPYFAVFQTNSWGNARTRDYTSVSAEIDDIIWRLDVAIMQSQSNAGNQDSRPQAWAKNIISVGGVRHFNTLDTSDDAWNGSASIGPASDGRIKPDLNYWYDSILTTTTGSGYTQFGGTSAATPEVAGVLGLVLKQWSDNVWGTNPSGSTVFERRPHASTAKALMINNANQYPFSGTGADLTRVHQGWGRPNSRVARERAATSFVVNEEQALTVGQTASYSVTVPAGESELKVTMVYPDPPGSPSAAIHRVNDLSLRVTSPSGTVYHGNVGLTAGNYSTSGGSPNTLDTVENVFVQNPQSGTWTVAVNAAEINQDAYLATSGVDDAVFALVVTGASAGGGCTPQPVADAGPDQTITQGQSVTLGTAAQSGHSYSWSPGGATTAQITVSPASTTTYTVTATTSCGSASDAATITVQPPPSTCPAGSIDFDSFGLESYSNQDLGGTAVSSDGGTTLTMTGNAWKRSTQSFAVNAGTVVEFEFASDSQGEIHAVGFDEDQTLNNSPRHFQFWGTQNWTGTGKIDFTPKYTGGGAFQSFSVPVGQSYTGSSMRLVLTNDKDSGTQNNQSRFRCVRVVQSTPPPTCSVEENFEGGAGGWTNNSGASTCTTGSFVVGTPTEVVNGGVTTQLAGDHTSGSGNAFFSATNSSAGVDDTDGGNCVVESPTYSVTEASDVSIWYFHGQRDAGNDPSGDFFRLEISTDGGASYSTLASFGDVTVNAAWTEATTTVPAGASVRFRVQTSDGAGPGDLVEAGVDDLAICPQ